MERLYARTYLPQSLAGKQVIVFAGGQSRERIDQSMASATIRSRYYTAQAADWLGATVTLVSTTQSLLPLRRRPSPASGVNPAWSEAMTGLTMTKMDYTAAVSDYRATSS